jgi:hypothetical protein
VGVNKNVGYIYMHLQTGFRKVISKKYISKTVQTEVAVRKYARDGQQNGKCPGVVMEGDMVACEIGIN